MSAIQEERVDLRAATLCASETGHIYIVGRTLEPPAATLAALDDQGNPISTGDTCATFQV